MSEFRIVGAVSASKYLGTYEATNAEEAIAKMLEAETYSVSVCHQCSGDVEDPEIHTVYVENVETGEDTEHGI